MSQGNGLPGHAEFSALAWLPHVHAALKLYNASLKQPNLDLKPTRLPQLLPEVPQSRFFLRHASDVQRFKA